MSPEKANNVRQRKKMSILLNNLLEFENRYNLEIVSISLSYFVEFVLVIVTEYYCIINSISKIIEFVIKY